MHVDPLPDLDIDDDHGNLVANRMELIGHPCWSVVGSYILVNPNLMDNNVDLFDGPGNTDVRGITYTFTDLKGFETGWVIPASQVSHVDSVTSLRCGHAHRNVLQVAVGNVLDDTYIGTVTATGARRSDEFTLALTVTVSGGNPTSGFWGASAPGANELHWTEFDLGEVGFNLYRSQAGGSSFSRLNGSLLEERSYRDQSVFPGVEYQYKLGLSRDDGGELLLGPISLKALGKPPRSYALLQNCPNPFHQRTDIRFGIPVTGHTALRIYDAAGRLVRTLVDEKKEAGYYSVHWNGKDSRQREVASGIYFYSMEAGSFSDTKKMVVLR